jgi:hypothetical protein
LESAPVSSEKPAEVYLARALSEKPGEVYPAPVVMKPGLLSGEAEYLSSAAAEILSVMVNRRTISSRAKANPDCDLGWGNQLQAHLQFVW